MGLHLSFGQPLIHKAIIPLDPNYLKIHNLKNLNFFAIISPLLLLENSQYKI